MLPEHAPARFADRETLWNEVQNVEKRSDAQFAREIEVAFPNELWRDEQMVSEIRTEAEKKIRGRKKRR